MSPTAPLLIENFVRRQDLPASFVSTAERLHLPLALKIKAWEAAHCVNAPLVIGLCGPQGSGKSTLTALVKQLLEADGLRIASLSLDDIYLGRAARDRLAQDVHPLLATRGVPGTHEVALGLSVLDDLARPGAVALPRFDKTTDERHPVQDWPVVRSPVDVILLEGWCLGARPEPADRLSVPVNDLERLEDSDGGWRTFVNQQLAGVYQALFARLDRLVLLTAPDFETVVRWRCEQEAHMRARLGADAPQNRLMSEAGVRRFCAHYERLTRWTAEDLPAVADLTIRLDEHRQPTQAMPASLRAG